MRGLIAMPKATALIAKKFDDQQMAAVAVFYRELRGTSDASASK
jgi:cytochrome c553